MKNVLVVSNYNAGRKQAVLHKKVFHKFLMKNSEHFRFISIEEFEFVNIDLYDTIFAIGGDGTVNKIIPSIINTDKVLGIIPCGTANLLAAKLGISMNLSKTLEIIKNGTIKQIDVITVNDKYCALRCGFGYDSDIICKTPQSFKNKFGYFAYFAAGILFALRLKERNYRMIVDDESIEVNASCVIFANAANMYHNLVSLVSDSKLDDGLMDIFVLKTTNPVTFFIELVKIIFKIRKSNKNAEYIHARNVTIENTWAVCHVDGEKKNLKNEIKIKFSNNKINVFALSQ